MFTYTKSAECDDDLTACQIRYDNLDPQGWDRIVKNSLILSDAGIGPQIYEITENPYTITYQYVDTLSWPLYHPTLTREQLQDQALAMVDYMHNVLDIAHTDLAPCNIGYIGEKLYFIDHDDLFKISEGVTPWVQAMMDLDEMTFDQLVNSDYRRFDNWSPVSEGDLLMDLRVSENPGFLTEPSEAQIRTIRLRTPEGKETVYHEIDPEEMTGSW